MANVAKLLHEQELLKSRINKMIHGSVEIRERNEKNIFMSIIVMREFLHQNMLVNIAMN